MKIQGYEAIPIETGRFRLDGGAMFGVVPKTLWGRYHEADKENRIELALRVLLLVSDREKILIDTGIGEKWPERQREMFAIDHTNFSLTKSLADLGLSLSDITHVILTHLHFDHAGGATCRQGDEIVPTFPNARYYVQRANWEHALYPNEKDRASYLPENFLPLKKAGVIQLLDGMEGFPFRDKIELVRSDGHTIGLQMPKISDGKQTLLYCADLIPTATHVRVPWVMAYDLFPLISIEEKKKLLWEAFEQKWILFLEHDPKAPGVYVMQDDKGGFVPGEAVGIS